MEKRLEQAALFIDFENIYYFIKNRSEFEIDAHEAAITTVRKLRTKLLVELELQCIIQHSYADFERIGGTSQGSFYLIGVETHNVLGTDHKNAADMRLCIDAMDTLYTRPEIDTFVFVAGDRDYIPIIQHLRKHAKHVLVVSFKGSVSGDLLTVAEDRNFIDAASVLPEGVTLSEVGLPRVPQRVAQPATQTTKGQVSALSLPTAVVLTPTPKVRRLESDSEREVLKIMLENFGSKSEIWMTPFLHRLRNEMPLPADFERKALISDLEGKGAISVEKRPGDQGDYTVILVNWNHPDVQALNPG